MIPSPLRLKSHFFTTIHVDACPQGCETSGEGAFSSQVEFARHEGDPAKWMVQLAIRKDADDRERCPEYTFDIQVVGLFEVDTKYPPEKAEGLVRANGPAVLFGAIREMVANLTARGPFPAVELPTVTFVDDASAPSAKPKSRPKARKPARNAC